MDQGWWLLQTFPSYDHAKERTDIACDEYVVIKDIDSTSKMNICPLSTESATRRPSGLCALISTKATQIFDDLLSTQIQREKTYIFTKHPVLVFTAGKDTPPRTK